MASHQSRTLQLLLIAFGFSFVIVGTVQLMFGYEGLYAATGLLAAGLITYAALWSDGLTLQALGGSPTNLCRALVVAVLTLGLCLLLGALLQWGGLITGPVMFVPDQWELMGYLMARGWAEELLFRGFLFIGLARLLDRGRLPWRAWLICSALFGLYHLPTALGLGLTGEVLAYRIGLPLFASLVLLVPLYLLSHNLWLAVIMHSLASMLVAPHLQERPLLALAFIAISLLMGRFLLRSEQPLPLTYRLKGLRVCPAPEPAPRRRVWHVI
ncbi:MAG: type II CAAX prenyl endopeptidase Rce1 family protein [Bacillota bacterium]